MTFALLTLLTALSLAAVAGWFSIVGFMAIYAGAPMYALVMGVVTEVAKLVTTSWIYRNWEYSDWKLKTPLIYFTLALMVATSIGVFGFLSKAHIEQGAGTIDNSAKVETLNYQIQREKSIIVDNEKLTKQLDDTVNSFLGKDKTDRALSVRRSQANQRKQLREDSAEAQKRIDTISTERFKLESEVRKMELDVGPIRYIAELFYGVEENASKNIEAAVRIFTLLIVSTLDPLAVILLIAANHTLIRLRDEKNKKIAQGKEERIDPAGRSSEIDALDSETDIKNTEKVDTPTQTQDASEVGSPIQEETEIHVPVSEAPMGLLNEEETKSVQDDNPTTETAETALVESNKSAEMVSIHRGGSAPIAPADQKHKEVSSLENSSSIDKIRKMLSEMPHEEQLMSPIIREPQPTRIELSDKDMPDHKVDIIPGVKVPWAQQESILREILGADPHFIPQKVTETPSYHKEAVELIKNNKYPKVLSWLTEFKRP